VTKIINLYGGPGIGKSATAAYLYYLLKKSNRSVELVQEYVKEWAWENRNIKPFDQIYFFGKQVRKESMLFGKVDYIITDSPVLLNLCYVKKCCDPEVAHGLFETARAFYAVSPRHNIQHIHIVLKRVGAFETNGRFHSQKESEQIDTEIRDLLREFGFEYFETSYDEESLNNLFGAIINLPE
jgi:AAA domain